MLPFLFSLLPTYLSDNLIQLAKDFGSYCLHQNILSEYTGISHQIL